MEAGGKDAARAAEEEALKRNTDCVYFLASPLTCKKGVECEYRHSEGARVNPRDCWYWMNGNCLNPKCGFRHPPLDGLMGTSTTITSGSASPAPPKIPTQASSTYSTPQNHSKQDISCFYFRRGVCLKGDRCPFVHGPAVAVPNPATQQATKVTMPVSEPPPAIRKTSWTLDKVPKQNIPNETSTQPIFAATSAKPQSKAETPAVVNRLPRKESTQSNIELRSETTGVPAVASSAPTRSQSRQSEPLDDECQNDREGDEYVRESSPGFDVLVDDENEEAGYFGEENEYGDASGHEGGSVNPAADFNYHHSSDYETASKFRREPYCSDADEYGYYVPANDYRTQEHHRAFPERDSERQAVSSRRRLRGDDNLVVVDGSDLRHQLLKKRRVNASRSGVSPDPHGPYWHDDHYFDEQRHRSHDRRSDQRNGRSDQRNGRRELSASNRLQGRISMPRRNPGDSNGDLHPDRGRSWGRLSMGKACNYSQRRVHERLNRRSNDNFHPDERSFGGVPQGRGDEQGNIDFAGPKSLSELKSIKVSNASEQGSTGSDNDSEHLREQRNAKFGKPLDHQDSSEFAEFEGPQPLSVILKRKREAAAANSKVASTTSAVASPGLQVHQHTESSRKDNQEEDPEAAAVDIEEQGEDPIIEGADVDQPYAIADGFEDGVVYSKDDVQEFEDYQEGDEYYQEYDDEYAEYEAEDAEGTYEGGEGEGGEDDFAKNVAVLH